MGHCHDINPADLVKGAYITLNPHHNLGDGTIFFSPDMKDICSKAAAILSVQGIVLRLVCVEDYALFISQDEEYRTRLTSCAPFFAPSDESWGQELGAKPLATKTAADMAQEIRQAFYGG